MAKKMSTPMERRTQKINEQYKPFLGELQVGSHKHGILKYLMEHRSITNAEAVEHLDCYRLGARISELREMGVNIITYREDNVNKSGQHGRYYLEERVSMTCLH